MIVGSHAQLFLKPPPKESFMSRWIASLVVIFFGSGLVHAGQPQGKLVLDVWDAAFLEGGKAGYVHTTVYELDRDGQKILRTTVDLHLTLKKFKETVHLQGVTGTEETAAGQVIGTFMTQQLGQKKQLTITGIVKGKQIELLLDGKAGVLKPAPWEEGVVGMYRQQIMFQEKKVKPGDKFSFLTFEPSVNLVLRTDVTVKDYEKVDLLDTKAKTKLLRVEVTPEKLEQVKLPTLTMWLNADGKPLRQQVEAPGLGKITLYRTSREVAMAPGKGAIVADIGINQLVRLNKKLLNPNDFNAIKFRITVKGEDDASMAFVNDDRQQVKEAKGATFVIQVKGSRGPAKGKPDAKIGDEFMQSSYFITSADAKVKELAGKAVGKETDAWKKALKIEKWVFTNVRYTNQEALAPADEVARTLEGDCTEFAMLMAAMCRAEGVPSRIAIGLVYADTPYGPAMGFHMWTEVWVQDQWVPLDATQGRGQIGPTHLKIADHSWHEIRSLTPLYPLLRVLGKVQIEIVGAQ
jgi:hypothetical protein